MNSELKQALKNYEVGDPISDDQLKLLIKEFKRLDKSELLRIRPEYSLVRRDIAMSLSQLQGYQDFRKRGY